MPTSPESRPSDARGTPRTSIYLAAALYCDGCSSPVRIRNISATGALLEGIAFPPSGALVQLVRGGLIVHGLVAWCAANRCGVKFSGSVDVELWRAATVNNEQHRVDDIVRIVKAGAVPLPVPPLADASIPGETECSGAQIAADLRRASNLLDGLGGELANDPHVVKRYGPALQSLDIAMQVIATIEAMILGEEHIDSIAPKLQALRRSADQALQRGR